MKFGHLTEYNRWNIFLENSYTKCGGKTSPRPFFPDRVSVFLESLKGVHGKNIKFTFFVIKGALFS